jgi:hypothetical protein
LVREPALWNSGKVQDDTRRVENILIEDTYSDGPFVRVRLKAGGRGTADDGEVLLVMRKRDVLRIEAPFVKVTCWQCRQYRAQGWQSL